MQPFSQRYFVENKGQWAKKDIHQQPILFAYDGQSEDYYFTKNAIQIDLIKEKWKKEEKEKNDKNHTWEEEEYALTEYRE